MSQVRKLKNGNNIPKAENGYKFILDNQEYNVTEDQLKEIDNRLAKLDPNLRRFLGGWTTGIKDGSGTGNRMDNTVSMNMISGVGKRDEKRLKAVKPNFWESLLPTDSYYAKQAIAEALGITNSVLNTSVSKSSKTPLDSSAIALDFNVDENGNYYLSPYNNAKAKERVSSVLNHLKAGDASEYDSGNWYFGNISDYISKQTGDDKYASAQASFDSMWGEMGKPGYVLTDDIIDLLANFNINKGNYGLTTGSESSGVNNISGEQSDIPLNEDGSIDLSKRTDKGEFIVWNGTGKDAGKTFTNSTVGDLKPYLLNKDRLIKYGLGDDYLNSIIYKRRIYKPDEVSQDINLQEIMDQVIRANNSARSTSDVWSNVGDLLDFTDEDNNYVNYDSSLYYMPYQYRQLRDALGEGSYSIFNPTAAYDTGGNEIFGIYDFNSPGTEQWGFRIPKYYIIGDDSLTSASDIPSGYEFLNKNWEPMNEYSNWVQINGKLYGLVGSFWGSDGHDTTPYQIYEDKEGRFWTKRNNGQMQELDLDLVQSILAGNKPNHNQMWYGTLNGKRRIEYNPEGPLMPPAFQHGPIYRKEGGKVELKPLPVKLQMGNKLSVAPVPVQQESALTDTPLMHSSNLWETLTPADQKEIIAAAIDVGGAIAGLAGPVGSVVGATTGLGSTGLFMSASKERKGHLDAGDWGQAALATGLDLVSIIPYLGETGKIAKIAKSVTRVAVPLGKAFNTLGLVEAASVLTKNPKEWDTNDLLKLSAGLQAVINVGHGAYVKRGESLLANGISEINSKQPLAEIKYRSERFKNADGTPIELDSNNVSRITDSKNKKPAETLRDILKGKGVSDDALKDVSDESLLQQFGFVTGNKGIAKGRRVTAQEQPKPVKESYSKYGWLGDMMWDPLAKREFARRNYIDKNLKDPTIRAKVKSTILKYNEDPTRMVVSTPTEELTHITHTPTNTPEARAYIQSLARLGEVSGTWPNKLSNRSELKQVTVDRTPGIRANVEAAIAKGEGLPNASSEIAKNAANRGLNEFAQFVHNEKVEGRTSSGMLLPGPKSIGRVANLGPSALSNAEIIAHLNNKEIPYSEAVRFLLSLPEGKRNSVLNAISKPGSGSRVKRLRAEYLKALSTSSTIDKATKHTVSSVADKLSRMDGVGTNARKAFNEAREIADNLRTLRTSKDPMRTLASLSKRKGFDQRVYDHAEEFAEALEYAKRHGIYNAMTKRDKNRYDNMIESIKNRGNLIFKDGGIIKAQDGAQLKVGKQENLTKLGEKVFENVIIKKKNADGSITEQKLEGAVPESILKQLLTDYKQQAVASQWDENGNITGWTIIQPNVEVNQPSPYSPSEEIANINAEVNQQPIQTAETSNVSPTIVIRNEAKPYFIKPKEEAQYNTIPMAKIENTVPIETPSVPLAKQNIVKVKTKENKNFNDLVSILESLLETKQYKDGGVIKGQKGISSYSLYPEGYEPKLQFESNLYKPIKSNISFNSLDYSPNNTTKSLYPDGSTPSIKTQPLTKTNVETKVGGDIGGGYEYNLSGAVNKLLPLLSIARFGVNAAYQNKYNRQWKKALEAGRFSETPVTLNAPRTDNPTYDRALQNIRSERMFGIKPYTSNWTEYNAAKQQHDAQLFSRENNLIGQQSADYTDKQNQVLNIQNQNIANQIATANSNLARNKSIDSAKLQADMALTQQRAQSWDNLGLEFENNLSQDKQMMQAFALKQYANQLQKGYDDLIDARFVGARAAYNTLPPDEAAKYYDLEDYLRRERSADWNANYQDLIKAQEKMNDSMLKWKYLNGLNYSYPSFMQGRYSSIGTPYSKKGGRINGTTRYRNEPDEQIWIDNNKATQQAVAKLNDNIIKLLLRALK